MGRTPHHRRSQAVPIASRSTPWSADRRARRRGDAATLPRRSPMIRGLAVLVAIGLCVAAGYFVYSALDGGVLKFRPNVDVVDRPVSDDRSVVIFQVRQGQTAASIGEEL